MEILDRRSKEEHISMEILDRPSEEEPYLWIPFQFLDQTLIAIFKCLGGLLSPVTKETASSPVTLNQPEEEQEEENVAMRDDVVVSTMRRKAKSKGKGKEKPSGGSSGKTNSVST